MGFLILLVTLAVCILDGSVPASARERRAQAAQSQMGILIPDMVRAGALAHDLERIHFAESEALVEQRRFRPRRAVRTHDPGAAPEVHPILEPDPVDEDHMHAVHHRVHAQEVIPDRSHP